MHRGTAACVPREYEGGESKDGEGMRNHGFNLFDSDMQECSLVYVRCLACKLAQKLAGCIFSTNRLTVHTHSRQYLRGEVKPVIRIMMDDD